MKTPGISYNRKDLIKICEKSIVQVSKWIDRDTPQSQEETGTLWALLKAGCEFEILNDGRLITDDETIWLRVYYPGFESFENGDFDLQNKDTLYNKVFYIPTIKKLNSVNGSDWYS